MLDEKCNLRIGVVGNCVSGKSTLVSTLRSLGYNAVNVPQEHSVSRRFWRRLKPEFLIYLSCTLPVARARRPIEWGQERLDQQWAVLSDAKEHAHAVIDTDPLTAEQVVALVCGAIDKFTKERNCDAGSGHFRCGQSPSPHTDIP